MTLQTSFQRAFGIQACNSMAVRLGAWQHADPGSSRGAVARLGWLAELGGPRANAVSSAIERRRSGTLDWLSFTRTGSPGSLHVPETQDFDDILVCQEICSHFVPGPGASQLYDLRPCRRMPEYLT